MPGDQLVCGGHEWDGHVPGRQREQSAAVQWRAQRVDTGNKGHVTCWDTLHRSSNNGHVAWMACYILMSGFSTGLSASVPPRVAAQVRGSTWHVPRDTWHHHQSCTCNVQATRMATPGSPPTWTSSRTPLDCSTNNALDIFFHFVLISVLSTLMST